MACIHAALLLCDDQVQALAHYDDVRLKSEKVGVYIVTYQLPQATEKSEFVLLGCFLTFWLHVKLVVLSMMFVKCSTSDFVILGLSYTVIRFFLKFISACIYSRKLGAVSPAELILWHNIMRKHFICICLQLTMLFFLVFWT